MSSAFVFQVAYVRLMIDARQNSWRNVICQHAAANVTTTVDFRQLIRERIIFSPHRLSFSDRKKHTKCNMNTKWEFFWNEQKKEMFSSRKSATRCSNHPTFSITNIGKSNKLSSLTLQVDWFAVTVFKLLKGNGFRNCVASCLSFYWFIKHHETNARCPRRGTTCVFLRHIAFLNTTRISRSRYIESNFSTATANVTEMTPIE